MNNDELKILLKSKGYSDSLIDWAIKFYPVMCDYFGYERIFCRCGSTELL